MNYLSVCSGIEAATVAWEPLGFKPIGFSEIEEFPCAVLKHHYPEVKNLGDMTQFQGWNINEAIDILAGGTPCQSFSIAGLRKGLDDPRGNLCLTYIAIAAKFKPRWIVWENVPGVLSSNGGRDFGSFLGALEKCGYGWSYRVLDAQWFGVAQRRRRVFVVANLGSWQRSAAVLFERKSLQRDTPPSREAEKRIAATITRGFGDCGVDADQIANGNYQITPKIAGSLDTQCGGGKLTHQSVANGHIIGTLTARFNALGSRDVEEGAIIPTSFDVFNHSVSSVAHTLSSRNDMQVETVICPKKNTDMVLEDQGGSVINVRTDGTVGTLRRETHGHEPAIVTYGIPGNWIGRKPENGGNASEPMHNLAPCLTKTDKHGVAQPIGNVLQKMAVRRLTPVECERLQGFPDNYTLISYRKKPAEQCPDSPRYKALGNSMAVPVMRWIGERIAMVEAIK